MYVNEKRTHLLLQAFVIMVCDSWRINLFDCLVHLVFYSLVPIGLIQLVLYSSTIIWAFTSITFPVDCVFIISLSCCLVYLVFYSCPNRVDSIGPLFVHYLWAFTSITFPVDCVFIISHHMMFSGKRGKCMLTIFILINAQDGALQF